MEANFAARAKHKEQGAVKGVTHAKGDRRHHQKNKKKKKSGSKSGSKSKKRGGLLCCRRKKKRGSSGKRRHHKSRTTKKQPRGKRVKTLAPVPNEQLGDVVLVKNIEKPSTPLKSGVVEKAECVSPFKSGKGAQMLANLNMPKIGDSKEKVAEAPTTTEKEEKKSDEKKTKKTSAAAAVSKSKEDVNEGGGGGGGGNESDEKKEVWTKMAKKFIDQDANLAVNDFEQVSSYIPPHVTKHQFVANMSSNRFADVVCLDHSRVTLNDGAYVHASYVEVDPRRKAILTQLPLPHTAADFWQMCIENQVKCVLLLLTEHEYDELGGDFVFPLAQDFLHFEERSIRVGEFKQIEMAPGWTMRVMSVTNGDYKSFLHVHHYKLWPHDSIPRGADAVKQTWQVQTALRKYAGPHVYVSLSGCGRAGSWALFEMAHSAVHNEPPLDMVKCLENVRNGRMHAVQNVSQFAFVYALIAEHVLGNGFCKLVTKADAKKGDGDDEETLRTAIRQMLIEP